MPTFIHAPVRQNVAVTADSLVTFDLPSNPISHILFTLRYANSTANVLHTLVNVVSALDRVSVVHDGQSIVSLNGRDLFAYSTLFLGVTPWTGQRVNTQNGVGSITFVIPFGRRLFDGSECFPASRRGALQMEIDYASSFTSVGSLSEQIEVVQLPDAQPRSFVRCVASTHTPTAVGQSDVDLPIGNVLLGVIVFSTTVPTGTSRTTTANQVRLLANDTELCYALTNWETLYGSGSLHAPPQVFHSAHFHMENVSASYTQNADTHAAEFVFYDCSNYGFLDLDPTRDGAYAVDSRALSSFKLRFDAGDTNALRVLPIELVSVGGAVARR